MAYTPTVRFRKGIPFVNFQLTHEQLKVLLDALDTKYGQNPFDNGATVGWLQLKVRGASEAITAARPGAAQNQAGD